MINSFKFSLVQELYIITMVFGQISPEDCIGYIHHSGYIRHRGYIHHGGYIRHRGYIHHRGYTIKSDCVEVWATLHVR